MEKNSTEMFLKLEKGKKKFPTVGNTFWCWYKRDGVGQRLKAVIDKGDLEK